MAILTSKGARAPHQLKGRRNVRISRDRRGCGNDDIEQLKDEVNKALADCQKKYYIEGLKDANLATSSGIMNSYRVNYDCANTPVARIGVLTVYGYVNGQYYRTTQEYVTNDDSVTTGEKYIRYGMSNNSGTSWTWSDWEKLVTKSELSNYAKYHTVNLQANETINIKSDWGSYLVNTARDGNQYSLSAIVDHVYQDSPSLHYLYDKGNYLDVTTNFSGGKGNVSIKNTSTEMISVSIIELNREVTYTIS